MTTPHNLELWTAVEKTDPSQTKPITGKPYKGTSPKPYWVIKRATEVFGPCGIGWGFTISQSVYDGAQGDKIHVAHVKLWYKWNGERGEIEHVGQTMLCGKNKNGPFTDEDAPKKSVTDALVKALSMLGFAGDIFMGRYDDSKYVAELRAEMEDSWRTKLFDEGEEAAQRGLQTLQSFWAHLTAPQKHELGGAETLERWKGIAARADKEAA